MRAAAFLHAALDSTAAARSVSRSLMRMIERRQFFDKLVVYGGMLLTTLLIFAMWWYLY